jgi:diguanylate cyclase (GGDEF)-like protein
MSASAWRSGIVGRTIAGVATAIAVVLVGLQPAYALKPISVSPDQERVEVTSLGEVYESRGDSLQLDMAAASDGVSGRMTVRATTPGTNPNWVAFALQNATDKPIERWLTAERYTMFGSGAVWPDLDARRLEAVTPSLGFVPERIKSDRADIFRITLEPGQTITYVGEFSSERFARVYLWKPIDYELKVRDRQLFNGVLLGITGLLAVFLTAVFAANHKMIFPSAALVAWCVLAHLTVDFGFFHKLFQLRPEDSAIYRAATESAMAASLVMFLHTFLKLGRSHALIRMVLGLWIAGQIALVAVAVVDPRLASTFARLSFLAIGGIGALATLLLALRGQDRALAFIPTWLLFLVWVFGAGVVLTGRLANEMAVSGLVAGLVLIVVLIGFTVTQFAFRSLEPSHRPIANDQQHMSALAIDGSGAGVFEWLARRNEIKTSSTIEALMGLQAGDLSSKVDDFLKHVHEADRERFRLMLWSVQERAGARIHTQFRLRHVDKSSRWFELDAASVPGADPRALRYVGLLRDITDGKRAHDRLLNDAVHCSLTGLPNRALFLDRLRCVVDRARTDDALQPTILLIGLDNFKSINASVGLPVGDSLLLTVARRLQRHVEGRDTLARVGGDQFAILFEVGKDPAVFAREAELIRRALRAPMKMGGRDVVLTGSIGIAIFDGTDASESDLLSDAEGAMVRAKRAGSDRIELFQPDMRADREDRLRIEADIRQALERGQLQVVYQPIIYLPTEELSGFEALVRYDHPKLGLINPATFLPVGESNDLGLRIVGYALARASKDAARWQKELPRTERPLFVSLNIETQSVFRTELVRDVRQIFDQGLIPRGSLRLEVPESLVMENPEQAGEILEALHGVGVELALDDFGAGYSSLAYLQRFPFDTFKIERSIVQACMSGDPAGVAVVRSMVAMANELTKKVVAEGVENPEDITFLRGIGCAYAQGFYYGDPMPDRDVLQLLRLVRKAERGMRPQGFFRMTAKRRKGAVDGAQAGAPATQDTTASTTAVKSSSETPLKRRSKTKAIPMIPATVVRSSVNTPSVDELLVPMAQPPSPNAPVIETPTYAAYDRYETPRTADDFEPHQDYLPPQPIFEPPISNPLSSLQAGLDAATARAEAAAINNGRLGDLSVAFNTAPSAPERAPAYLDQGDAYLARQHLPQPPTNPTVAPSASPPTVRTEIPARVRTVRPPVDLSKLPPGIAASLAKLAGDKPLTSSLGVPVLPIKRSGG